MGQWMRRWCRLLTRFLRLRPFLWPVPLVIAAYIGSIWLERGISYDDGGIGGVVFFVTNTIGVVGLWLARILYALLDEPIVNTWVTVAVLFPAVTSAGCLPYVLLDRLSQRWLASRTRTADPSPSLRSGSG